MKASGGCFLLVFGLFWSGLTLVFDAMILRTVVLQWNALRFTATNGVIKSSKVTHSNDSDGCAHGVAVEYVYTVAGRDYTGRRYRFDTMTSSDSAWAHRAVAERPPGSKVKVFYNPKNPAEALLSPGLEGMELFMLAFMTPFNVVMLGLWAWGFTRLKWKWKKPPAGGVSITTKLRQTRARLTSFPPLGTCLATLALLAFLSIFAVGFLGGGFHPSLRTMLVTWAVILGGALLVSGWHQTKALQGKYDLVIDEMNGVLHLPATKKREAPRRIPVASVRGVSVEKVEKSRSDDDTPNYAYVPTLELTGEGDTTAPLVEWYDEEKTEAFAAWLREKLRLQQTRV